MASTQQLNMAVPGEDEQRVFENRLCSTWNPWTSRRQRPVLLVPGAHALGATPPQRTIASLVRVERHDGLRIPVPQCELSSRGLRFTPHRDRLMRPTKSTCRLDSSLPANPDSQMFIAQTMFTSNVVARSCQLHDPSDGKVCLRRSILLPGLHFLKTLHRLPIHNHLSPEDAKSRHLS